MTDPYTDRERLRSAAYADSSNLKARKGIYAYRVPPLDFREFIADLVDWRGDEALLDVGCGSGDVIAYVQSTRPGLRSFAADLSLGMAKEAKDATRAYAAVADAVALPFPSGTFDVTLAVHMLYHVPDVAAAVREIRRVTSDAGVALVAVNDQTHLREIKALFAEALAHVRGHPVPVPAHPDARVNLGNGEAILAQAFTSVRRKATWGTLAVTDPAAVVAYVRSLRALGGAGLGDEDWERLVAYVAERAASIVAADGSFDAVTRAGVFVCRP